MEDSQPGSNVFSVRIVSIDYYIAPPIPGLDICYSSFQGGKVNEVPVIRIYGSTPAGQKTCLHVHRALPYFYIPCSELMLQLNQEARKIDDRCLGDACAQLISLSLEKSLKLKGSAGSKRQHVHGCSIVRTRKFYGYHSLEELFAKIYLTCNVLEHVIDLDGILSYYPQDISRAANLLLGGAVLDKSLQPHESHIPFLLQFLVDYNLYGMGHLHVSKLKFRHPIPNYFTGRKGACSGYGSGTENCTYLSAGSGDPRGDASLSSPIWTSVSVPDDWTWESSGQLASSSSVDGYLVKRQSTCELEGDAAVDEIINQKSKIYSSLSQTRKDVKMVQSLIPIWEEEYERSGTNEVALLSDPGKPPPEDVLRTLTCGLGFETVLMELYNKAENDSPCIPFEKNVSYVESGTPAANEGNIVELGLSDRPKNGGEALNCLKGSAEAGKTLPQSLSCTEVGVIIPPEGKGICPEHLPIDDAQTLAMIGRSDVKIVDKEALGLLSWLASSQAAEDINSDDELARETILTPLLPETTINEVLEKANMDFESESQQECQDILDSLEDSTNIEVLKQRSSTYQGFFNQSSPEKRIPQVDGSADDQNSVCDANELSETELSYDFKSSGNVKHATGLPSFSINSKRNKPLWAPLPFSLNQKVNDGLELLDRHQVFTNEVRASGSRGKKEADKSDCDPKKESALVECSVHDLMRRKRYYHFKTSEPERKASLEDEQQYQKQIDGPADDQNSVLDANELSETELSNDFKSSANVQHATGLPSFTINSKRNKSLWAPLPFSLNQKENDGLEPLDRFHGLTNEVKGSGSREKNDADKRDCDQKKESALVECSVRDLMRRKRSYHFSTPESERQRARKASLEDEQHEKQIEVQAKHSIQKDQKFQVFAYSEASETNEMNRAHRVKSDIENSTLKLCGGASAVKPICPSYSLHGHHDEVTNQASSEHQNLANSEPEKSFKFLGPATSMGHYASDNLGGSGKVYAVEPVTSEVCACKPVVGIETPKLDTYEKLLANERCLQRESIEASPLTVSRVQSGILGMGDCICKNGHKEKAFTQMVSEISSANISTIFQSEDYSNIQHNSSSNPKELVGMTLYKKPPVVDSAVGRLENASSHPINAQHIFPDSGRGYEGISAADPRKPADELPHFFERDCLDDGGCQKKISRDKYLDYNQVLMGVPIHYQNDGSYLYMLTSVISPPSANCVSRWLSHDDSGKNHGASVEPASPEGSSSNQLSSQCSLVGSCKMTSQEVRSLSEREAIPDQIKKQTHGNLNAQMNLTGERVMEIFQNGCNNMKGKECCDSSLDISQISGPEGRSKPTPLSQTGFRDPASFGGGQQLTLLSMEVQAESRGELRPDPRFDAVNVIVLAFQEDNDCTLDIYVLLRSSTEYNQGNLDGISGCKVLTSSEERGLFNHFINIICSVDPDLLMGWDIQGNSLGFLAERAVHLGINLLNGISRTPTETKIGARELAVSDTGILDNVLPEHLVSDSIQLENAIIEDEWGRTHASGVHVGGRVVLNIWRLMRSELKLNIYSIEAVAEAVLRRKVPCIQSKVLTSWFSGGPARARYRCIEHVVDRAKLNLEIMNKLDMINRTSELSRVFGIDFFSVLSRGSQYRVESMLLRLVHTQNYVAISPGAQQVASQPAMECLPLVMEPESGFYADPVVVLDFQSLYPSMIIAYNLCFCTCLGNVVPSKSNTLGVSSYSPSLHLLRDLKHEILLTPNGVMYVPSKVRKGVLPRLLEEILSTRIMVKQAMKKLAPSQQVLHRIFNARQLALKLIANVTYGYTAAGFSGRMPCAELADSIVQCGRRTLENAISFVNAHNKWNANVIYGDTDSMFVLLKGRTVKEAFEIGHEIASVITSLNPSPVTLKMEKVYHPCFLLTKKRYVGYSYENPGQVKPTFDAKGIETVRRDTCGAVAKIMEQSLRLFFEHKDIYKVREYLQRQWTRILSGRVSLQDFVFAKEVRLGTYSTRASSSLPPAAIVATKAMKADPRAEPRYAERVPYVVVHGEPGSRLVDMVVDPLELLAIDSHFRLNDVYYIRKQIIPALQRVFGLVGADLNQWYTEMPRPGREFITKRLSHASNSHRTRIDYYYLSKHCVLCGDLVQASSHLCGKCSKNEAAVAIAIIGRTSKLEKEIQHLAAICRHCGGGDWAGERSVKCTSLACPIFYERRKVQKELQALSTVATDSGLYPKCVVEWF